MKLLQCIITELLHWRTRGFLGVGCFPQFPSVNLYMYLPTLYNYVNAVIKCCGEDCDPPYTMWWRLWPCPALVDTCGWFYVGYQGQLERHGDFTFFAQICITESHRQSTVGAAWLLLLGTDAVFLVQVLQRVGRTDRMTASYNAYICCELPLYE